MIEHYREDRDFKLPDIESFRRAPGFRARKIQAYQRPSDDIVDRLFSELEASKESEPERYLICWLAITFGLRKSEIAACKSDWFIPIKGRTHIEIRAVETKSATRDYTKNGQAKPCSSAGLGGWEKIKPMIQAMEPGQYLIQGSRSYRTDVAFRKINKWLRQLGWRTFKVIHELRKLAGSEMIMKSGIYAASQFLRHGNISTTQKFYGKYADVTISDEPIKPRNRVPNQVPNDAVLDAVTPIPDSDLTGISEVPGGDKTGQSAPTQTTDSDGVINVIT
jgi:integrase